MNLFVSFSGGRTSGYMTKRILDQWRDRYDRVVILFANTGKEQEATLRFVEQCDRAFGLGVVWVEAVVHPERGKGTTHRVVSFNTASRKGEPFEAAIRKFGIPNKHYPHCTRELKQRPMFSYLRSLGWKPGSFEIAIGIRVDEVDRISARAETDHIVYPLVKWGVKKTDVLAWWRQQPFDLYLPEHLGNCDFCWKKSLRKHLTLALEHPSVFDFPIEMELRYPFNGPGTHDGPRRFFRGNRSALDIVEQALTAPFEPFVDNNRVFDPEMDASTGCAESCEVFADDFSAALTDDEMECEVS